MYKRQSIYTLGNLSVGNVIATANISCINVTATGVVTGGSIYTLGNVTAVIYYLQVLLTLLLSLRLVI